MLDDFLWRAALGGLGVALATGPLGCFVVWQRMAYFGASVAHTALLGVALGFVLSIDLTLGITVTCIAFAVVMVVLRRRTKLTTDTLLGILAHAALATGLVTLAFMKGVRIDLMAYLFGDILTVSPTDIFWIFGGSGLTIAILIFIWKPLLAITVHEELAKAEGIPVHAVQMVFTLLLALVIAVSMKIVGALLIISLLIIPAATARPFSRSPEHMAVLAIGIGVCSVAGGLFASFRWDTPSGPSIVVAAFLLFAASLFAKRSRV